MANMLSNPDREKNYLQERFTRKRVIPLSDETAAAVYEKDKTKKKVVVFFFWNRGIWWHVPPKDTHVLGMSLFAKVKTEIEEENYDKDF